jgi:glyoxylase I family protein
MITALLHTTLMVTDLAKAEQFYSQVLGLTVAERNLNFPGMWYQIGPSQIHLMLDQRRPDDVTNTEKLGRNRHVALGVQDLDALKAQLQAAGYPCQLSASGRAALFTRDPDGNVLEFAQISA